MTAKGSEKKAFVYLASSQRVSAAATEKDAAAAAAEKTSIPRSKPKLIVYIGRSRHPFVRVQHHNRVPGFTEGPKETKAGAPRWRLELILGPFPQGTHHIQKEWKERTRGHRARLQRGLAIGLREQSRLGRQVVWYNDDGDDTKTPHPSPSPSPRPMDEGDDPPTEEEEEDGDEEKKA